MRKQKDTAPDTLCEDGKNPTKEYIIKRWWGLNDKHPCRKVPLCDGQWMVWWEDVFLQKYHETH